MNDKDHSEPFSTLKNFLCCFTFYFKFNKEPFIFKSIHFSDFPKYVIYNI